MLKQFTLSALAAAFLLGGAALATEAPAMQKTVTVGGAPMYPTKNIIQNASQSKDHTTLVKLVKEADLVKTLEGTGPFTVFAPTDAAFKKLGDSTLKDLQKTESKTALKEILSYHVVKGKYTTEDLKKTSKLTTVEGETLTVTETTTGSGKFEIADAKGNTATITTADVLQSNGVIHVVDQVLLPSKAPNVSY